MPAAVYSLLLKGVPLSTTGPDHQHIWLLDFTRHVSDNVIDEDKEQGRAQDASLRDSFFQCLLVAVSSIHVDSGFPICQVLGDPQVHTSRYTTFLEFKSPIFTDPVICLLHVCPHCQSMLFILKAILDLLGNVGHLVFSITVLPKACLLWSDDVVLLQVPCQASVDHSFHGFCPHNW